MAWQETGSTVTEFGDAYQQVVTMTEYLTQYFFFYFCKQSVPIITINSANV